MHILWFMFMTSSALALICNNMRIIIDPLYVRRMKGSEALALIISHIVAYVIFYFSLTNFIGHMAARF